MSRILSVLRALRYYSVQININPDDANTSVELYKLLQKKKTVKMVFDMPELTRAVFHDACLTYAYAFTERGTLERRLLNRLALMVMEGPITQEQLSKDPATPIVYE